MKRPMWIHIGAAFALTLLGFGADLSAQTLQLSDPGGTTWVIDVGGTGDGTDGSLSASGAFVGATGALAQFPRLCVLSDQSSGDPCTAADIFAPGASRTLTTEFGNRQVVIGGEALAGLEVTRKLYIPQSSTVGGYARVVDILENNTVETISVKLRYGSVVSVAGANELRAGAAAGVVESGSGDLLFGVDDDWLVVDDADAAGAPALGVVLSSPGASVRPSAPGLNFYGGGAQEMAWEYADVQVRPGAMVTLLHLYVQDADQSSAAGRSAALASHAPEIFAGLSQLELGSLVNVAPRRPSVLILTSDDAGAYNDVVETLASTGSVAQADISVVDISDEALPTLDDLLMADVVLCWLRQTHAFRAEAGDLLADYVDAGGDVVVMPFSFGGSASLTGRWLSETYSPITQGSSPALSASAIGTRLVPAHPLLIEVDALENAVNRSGSSSVNSGATRVANWADGRVMLATREGSGGRIAALGFYPVSDRNRSDQQNYWNSNTDGDFLLRNAIYWAAGYDGTILPGPDPVAGTGGPYDIDEGTVSALSGKSASTGHRLTFSWDLDENGVFGEVGNERAPNPVFRAFDIGGPATVAIALRVTDRIGRTDEASGVINIVNRPPSVDSLSGPMMADEGEQVTFTASVSDPFADDVVTVSWDFDDGELGTGASVMHTFVDQGIFDVQAIANDGDDLDVEVLRVSVRNADPVIDMLEVPSTGNEGEELSFSVTATDPGVNDTLSYLWSFGGDEVEGASVVYTWPNDGTWPVTVTVSDGDGGQVQRSFSVEIANVAPVFDVLDWPMVANEGEAVPFTAEVSDPGGDSVSVTWNFGDSPTPQMGLKVTHAFGDNGTWTIIATVDDGQDADSTIGSILILNQPPSVTGIVGPAEVVVGEVFEQTVVFDDPGSFDTHTVQWDLGAAGSATTPTASMSFDETGVVTISVTVTDDEGASDTETRDLLVRGVPPTITAFSADQMGDEGETFDFSVSADAPGCAALSFMWFFGDGESAPGATVQHVYADDGEFNAEVAVTCEDDAGQATRAAGVSVRNIPPTIDAFEVPQVATEGVAVPLFVQSSDPGADVVRYLWSVGSEEVETSEETLQYAFPDDGTYQVFVRAVDDDLGEVSSASVQVEVSNASPACEGSSPTTTFVVDEAPVVYETSLEAFDVAADRLDWRLSRSPQGMFILDDGRVNWSLSREQYVQGEVELEAEVFDDEGASCTFAWTLSVELADDDDDGIPNFWERDNGLDPGDPGDADEDSDGDGASNLEEYLRGTDPSSFDGLRAPQLLFPIANSVVATANPEFLVENVASAETLTLQLEVYGDEGLTNLVLSTTLPQAEGGSTSWRSDDALEENALYWWRARAVSETIDGQWSAVEGFQVNISNEAPTLPTHLRPDDGSSVDTTTPTLAVDNSTDNDSFSLTYDFRVMQEGDVVAEVAGVEQGPLGSTVWTVDVELSEDTLYTWQARAVDNGGVSSGWTEPWRFVVNLDNRAPTEPVIVAPVDGSEVETLSPLARIENIGDPDGDIVLVDWQVAPDADFARIAAEGEGVEVDETRTISFEINDLEDNTAYALRARVRDQESSSDWVSVRFFVNLENDAPGMPTLLSPIAEVVVSTETPLFELENAEDVDGDSLDYNFVVYGDEALTEILGQETVASGSATTSWQLPEELALDNGTYYWTARARDEHGAMGLRPEVATFSVSTLSAEIDRPVPISPIGAVWNSKSAQIFSWQNAASSDESPLVYVLEVFEIEPGETTLGERIVEVSGIAEAEGETTEAELEDRLEPGDYAWRVIASFATGAPVESEVAVFAISASAGGGGSAEEGCDCAQVSPSRPSRPMGWLFVVLLGLIVGARFTFGARASQRGGRRRG